MNKIVNLQLLANPLNWLVVWMMLLLMGIFGHFILTWAEKSHTPKTDNANA